MKLSIMVIGMCHKEGCGPLLVEGIPAKTLCAKDVPTKGGLVGSLYASLSILFTSPCIKINLASLCVAIASAAVSTASVSTSAGVDTVGLASDVVLPIAVVCLGGGIGSGVVVGVDVDVMFDCCDAIV